MEDEPSNASLDDEVACFSSNMSIAHNAAVERLTWRMDPEESFSDWEILLAVGKNDRKIYSSYHVHRNVVGLGKKKSEYFARIFRGSFAESEMKTSRLELDQSTADAFPVILDYMYSSTDELELSHANAAALYQLGDYLGIESLLLKIKKFWTEATPSIAECESYYNQSIHFSNTTLRRFVVKFFSNHIANDKSDAHLLVKALDTKLCIKILDQKYKMPSRRLARLICMFCEKHQDSMDPVTFYKLTNRSSFISASAMTSLKLLRLEKALVPDSQLLQSTDRLTNLQEQCIGSIVSSWVGLNSSKAQECTAQLHPFLLSKILTRVAENAGRGAGKFVVPEKIIVSGAGTAAVNGTYLRDAFSDGGLPTFIVSGVSREGKTVEIRAARLRSGSFMWFFCIPDKEQPGTDRDVDFYSSEAFILSNFEKIGIPKTGWRLHSSDKGTAPAPSLNFVYEEDGTASFEEDAENAMEP